ncbi:MAG TPA: hypothetical protein VNB89_05800 [Gemmatimonadaceae bacterium]|nr:hypothetical protein [Gemmatimonadaceae bacterium]
MPNDPQTPAGHSKPAFDPYARPALPNIPPPDDTGGPGRAMWCSDCRAPLRPHYYAMNTRPVCAKCKGGYEAQIARGTGSAAFVRAFVWGGAAALGGAVVLAAILLSIGAVGRILMAIGIGWAVGTAISKANGGYPGRHYQILAALLTYFAIGLGSMALVVRDVVKIQTKWVADSTRGAHDDSARAALAARQAEESGTVPESEIAVANAGHPADWADSIEAASQSPGRRAGSNSSATKLGHGKLVGRIGVAIVMLFTLPLLTIFAFGGIYGAVITLGALCFGMYKAWDLTSGGPALEVTGPHKVGTGPIVPAF